jgi:dTMP kinase
LAPEAPILPGRFIVVEGGDGSGKGGVVASIVAALQDDGRDVLTTREPGGTPEGLKLRALLLAASGAVWEQEAELLLMVAARVQHVRRVIQPALAAGRHVICDRFVGSTLAYQGGGRGLPETFIRELHRQMVDDVWPDLTLLLDVDPQIGLARARRRLANDAADEGRFEALALSFHDRVRRSFLAQAAAAPARSVVIDAGQAIDVVQAQAVDRVRALLAADKAMPAV